MDRQGLLARSPFGHALAYHPPSLKTAQPLTTTINTYSASHRMPSHPSCPPRSYIAPARRRCFRPPRAVGAAGLAGYVCIPRPGQARPGSRARRQASRPKAWRGMSPRKRTLPDGGQRHRESRQWNPSPHEAPRRFHCLCRAASLPLPRRRRLSVWSSLSISGACKARIKTLAQDVSVSFFIFLGQKAGHAACHWWADSTPAGGLKASGCAAD
ncbi:uncharacterized protein IWZ02DRAFT_2251 [Phyllosticta citriasiana]|uniref:uncharacterized protein n=1 Tax=Phyllosticta citriasiana TaxID=595635 RepID=UPI0030FDE144